MNFKNLSITSKGPSSSHVPGSEHLLHPSLWPSLCKQQPVLSALMFTFLRWQHSHTHKRRTPGKAVIKSWSAQAIHLMYLHSVNGRLMVAMPAWRGLWNIYQQIASINWSTCSLSEEWDDEHLSMKITRAWDAKFRRKITQGKEKRKSGKPACPDEQLLSHVLTKPGDCSLLPRGEK